MSLLARALLIPAALSLWSTATIAKDRPGLPKDIIGIYAETPERCGDISLIEEFFEEGGHSYYGICGKPCHAPVVSHRRLKGGYVLNIDWPSMFGVDKRTLYVTKLGKGNLSLRYPGNQSFKLFRCEPA